MTPDTQLVRPDAELASRGETILLVDDHPVILDGVGEMLRRYRYSVLPASNVTEALAYWRKYRDTLHAVVSDYHLGRGRTGISLLRELSVAQPNLLMILTSASVTPDVMIELARTSTIQCLPKPYHYQQLLRLLRGGLDAGPTRRLAAQRRSVDPFHPAPPTDRTEG
ncbi:MAG: response regulator [Verrucomicrobia bacterium]|nr:response regulator [Verrucomicrobiota bacterium]